MRPSSSQRWGGLHGSSSNSSSAQQGDFPTASSPRSGTAAGSSRRAGTHPASSPRALSLASGGTAQPGSARNQQRGYSRDTAAGAGAAGAAAVADGREWRQSGSGSGRKAPKAATGMDFKEDKQDTREDSSRIRVAVRVSKYQVLYMSNDCTGILLYTRKKYFFTRNLRTRLRACRRRVIVYVPCGRPHRTTRYQLQTLCVLL